MIGDSNADKMLVSQWKYYKELAENRERKLLQDKHGKKLKFESGSSKKEATDKKDRESIIKNIIVSNKKKAMTD